MKLNRFLFVVAVAGLSVTFLLATHAAFAGNGAPVAGPTGTGGTLTANATVTSSGTIFLETGAYEDITPGSATAITVLTFTGTGGDGTGFTGVNAADTPSGASTIYLTAAVSTASTTGTLSLAAADLTSVASGGDIPIANLAVTNTANSGDAGTWTTSPTIINGSTGVEILAIPASGVFHATQAYTLEVPLGTPAATDYTTTVNYIFASI
jgi:hypothetical protein